ncbi:hypothetical protein BC833DRAFT_579558 [Globomyces pollinis-pini]|nr:hypothetical protein BC833DRAFT_579558 [Globomyces pollinis-pini]
MESIRNSVFVMKEHMSSNNSKQRNWGLYNVYLIGFLFVVLTILESLVILNVSDFIGETYESFKSGSLAIVCCYFGLFIFALFFQLYGAIEAITTQNTMQILAVSCFNIYSLVYSLIQITQLNRIVKCSEDFLNLDPKKTGQFNITEVLSIQRKACYFSIVDPIRQTVNNEDSKSLQQLAVDLRAALPKFSSNTMMIQNIIVVVMVVACFTGLFLAYQSYKQQGWAAYQSLGADLTKKHILRRYHLFILFLKINVFFFLGLLAQYMFVVYFYTKNKSEERDERIYEHAIYLFFFILSSLIAYILGYWGTQKANSGYLHFYRGLAMLNMIGLVYIITSVLMDNNATYKATEIWFGSFVALQFLSLGVTVYVSGKLLDDIKNDNGLDVVLERLQSRNRSMLNVEQRTEHELERMALD